MPTTIFKFHVDGDRTGSRNGWAVLHLEYPPAGVFGTWRGNVMGTWRADRRPITAEQREQFRRQVAAAKQQRDAETAARWTQAQESRRG